METLRSNTKQPFTTIDDVVQLADQLVDDLHRLAERKHPLAVRKGVRDVTDKRNQEDGEVMKGAGRTYFFDVRKTRDGKSFLTVTESRKDQDGKFVRASIAIFPEDKEEFTRLLTEKLAEI